MNSDMRHAILHYHLFKNAGTSIDAILQRNFGTRWTHAEFAGARNQKEVAEWIAGTPEALAFSSHTARLPVPTMEGVTVFPILFLRHPLDRIRSAYEFERRQESDNFGARLAKEHLLADYIRKRLERPNDMSCRNFHVDRLSGGGAAGTTRLERSIETVNALPFVGIVEDFEASVRRLESWLRPVFPDFEAFNARHNTTGSGEATLAERLHKFRCDVGDDFYCEIVEENIQDLCLYHLVAERLTGRAPPLRQTGMGCIPCSPLDERQQAEAPNPAHVSLPAALALAR
jgi:hypothetical protein